MPRFLAAQRGDSFATSWSPPAFGLNSPRGFYIKRRDCREWSERCYLVAQFTVLMHVEIGFFVFICAALRR
jgi:hypothetical protein